MTVNRYKKYNSVAAREWPNNAYSYNRNNEKLLSYKKDTVNKIIKSYFNLTEKEKSFKSKRMRDLIKRSSLLRLFNSKGIIKQNSDKVNVSIHTFNRRKSKMARNLFSFNKFLSKYKKHNIFTSVRALKVVNNYNNKSLLERIQLRDSNLTSLISKLNLTNYNNLFLHNRKKSKKFLSSSSPLLLTKNNNVKYHNIYMKNMYYPTNEINTKRKLNVKLNSSNTRLLASTFKRNKKLFYKKKKIMLQRKKGLLYKKLIKNLALSFERKKIILYRITSLRSFYYSILKSVGLSLYTSLKENLYTVSIKHVNTYDDFEDKHLIYKLPNKFSLIYNKIDINRKKTKMLKKITDLKFKRYIYINNILEKIIDRTLVPLVVRSNNSKKKDNWTVNNSINVTSQVMVLKNKLYDEFKEHNTQNLFLRYFSKQYLILNNIYKLYLDNEKHLGISNNLKYLLNKIYNKQVSLNIIELKYLHLNADILSNAVVVKLANMKNRLRNVIRKSLKLVKLGKPQSKVIVPLNSRSDNLLNTHRIKRTNVTFGNLLSEMYSSTPSTSDTLSNKILPQNTELGINVPAEISKNVYKIKTKEIIKNLKHKWITGIRMEGKGRLTNRYAAGRALYKYRAKGNLRSKLSMNPNSSIMNQNYLLNSNKTKLSGLYMNNRISKKNPYVPLFRGILIPNLQYVKKSGFRRIGAFGVKVWINNNS